MCALLLVKDCIISCYYHPTQGDYSGSPNFKMAALHFVNVTKEVMDMIKENSIPKRAKDAIKFGITLSKERCRVFVDGIK